jgi:hypothetical protein
MEREDLYSNNRSTNNQHNINNNYNENFNYNKENNNIYSINNINNNDNNNNNNFESSNSQNLLSLKNEIISKINTLNTHFDFFGFINIYFSEAEKSLISSNYIINQRFQSIFSNVEHLNYLYLMAFLNYQNDNGNVFNGIKETLRAIELKKAKLVYVAVDCEIQDYSDLIIKLCKINAIPYIKVLHWTNLRDVLFKGPIAAELEKAAKIKGKPVKITPKCNSAVVLFSKEEEDFMLKAKQKIQE